MSDMMIKGIPIPTLIGLLLLMIGGLIHIIGLATPYWHIDVITNSVIKGDTSAHYGLWVTCTTVGLDEFDCQNHNELANFIVSTRAMEILALLLGTLCIIVTGLWYFLKIEKHQLILMIGSLATGFLADFIVSTRAMEILALLLGTLCIIVTGLWYFLKIEKHQLILMIGSLATGFLAGLFGIIGIIIYGAEVNSQDKTTFGNLVETELSWSYALCTVSSCMVVIATICIGIGTRIKD